MSDQVIDLTDSFTLVDHTSLSNVVIELDDTINDSSDPCPALQVTSRNEVDVPDVEVLETAMTRPSVARSVQHRKKSKNSRKKMEKTCNPDDVKNVELIRERSPLRSQIGDCPICLESIGTKPLASTKCGHVFCQQCLIQALRLEKKCPTCRQALRGNSAYHPLFLGRG